MASAPLNWLLKIGGETLKTTAKTLSEAVNALYDSVTSLSTTKADADTTTTALDNLETNKLNISDLLSLEEIEASTLLTGKGITAESAKQINDSLASNVNELKTNFQAGVDSIYDAVVAKGSTPASKSLSDVVAGIGNIRDTPIYLTSTSANNYTVGHTGKMIIVVSVASDYWSDTYSVGIQLDGKSVSTLVFHAFDGDKHNDRGVYLSVAYTIIDVIPGQTISITGQASTYYHRSAVLFKI